MLLISKEQPVTSEEKGHHYGRHELRRFLHRYYFYGLAISIVFHLTVIESYYVARHLGDEEDVPTVKVRILKYSDLGPPPSITSAPPAIGVAAIAKPSIGVPVPVPDAEVSPEQTIPTQAELSAAPSPTIEEMGGGDAIQITGDLNIDEDPDMDEFMPLEKPPQIVKRVLPLYPELAVKAGIEGTVWVKILVDKEGKPRKAVVIKTTTEILNEAAVEAAMQFLFTPAVMNKGPVKVWVSIPFKFQLKEVQGPS
jgi:protein TonB